jgi:arylsulfatase
VRKPATISTGLAVAALLLAVSCSTKAPEAPVAGAGLDRTVLPIVRPTPPTITTLDARDATPPPRFEVKAPQDRPMS